MFPGRIILLAPSPTRPPPAVRRAPRPEPPMVCPGFRFDKCVLWDFFITQFRLLPVSYVYLTFSLLNHRFPPSQLQLVSNTYLSSFRLFFFQPLKTILVASCMLMANLQCMSCFVFFISVFIFQSLLHCCFTTYSVMKLQQFNSK